MGRANIPALLKDLRTPPLLLCVSLWSDAVWWHLWFSIFYYSYLKWLMNVLLLCGVDAPGSISVSAGPPGQIAAGSFVSLSCSSDANPPATYTWHKRNGDPENGPVSEEPQLVFGSIQPSDSGEYACIAVNVFGRRTSAYVSVNVKCE